ncbi:transposase [Neorhizobium sp. SOG26]|uniref:transposase n=1 Tax=Neorhizobium sp. SOG26 TaxID=2060726 RepID=UPI0040408D9C
MGRSRGGLTTKLHVVVDERRLPVRLGLTQGQASDKAAAPCLLEGLPSASVVIANRGYDWQHPNRPRSTTRRRGPHPNPARPQGPKVSRPKPLPSAQSCRTLLLQTEHFRRLTTRYDKLAANFLAAVALASARLWMRIYEPTT